MRIDHGEQGDEREVGGIDGSTKGMIWIKEEKKGMEWNGTTIIEDTNGI